MPKKFEVIISENVGKTIVVIDRLTCDVDEIKDKNLARGFKNG